MRRETAAISPIAEIIAEIRAGEIVILVDDEDRENEGDLVFAAEFVTPEKINFMAKHGRGLICMPITEEHAARLGLKPMVAQNRSRHGTNFTVSIEAAEGVTTGISAARPRAHHPGRCCRECNAADIVQPGHIFPLMAQPGGVLVRAGHTEACCDLARLAGLDARRGALRDHERRRHHGAPARPDAVRRRAQAQDRHHRRPDRVPQPQRIAGEARVGARDRDAPGALPPGVVPRPVGRCRSTSRWCWASRTRRRKSLVRVHEPLSILDLLDAGPGTHSWSVDEALAGDPARPAAAWWCC